MYRFMRFSWLISLSALLCSPLLAQAVAPALDDYFPLHIGDSRTYEVRAGVGAWDTTYYATTRVIGDSIMPNGKHYFALDSLQYNFPRPSYLRVDTLLKMVFQYTGFNNGSCQDSERVVFDLNYPNACGCFVFCDNFGVGSNIVTVTGGYAQAGYLNYQAQEISFFWALDPKSYGVSLYKGVGIGYRSLYLFGGEYANLIAATINGVTYLAPPTGIENNTTITHQPQLSQNYPNPFNPSTTIEYHLPQAANVTLRIYTITGEAIRTLVEGVENQGRKVVQWDGRNDAGTKVSSGIYLYSLQAGEYWQIKQMIVTK